MRGFRMSDTGTFYIEDLIMPVVDELSNVWPPSSRAGLRGPGGYRYVESPGIMRRRVSPRRNSMPLSPRIVPSPDI